LNIPVDEHGRGKLNFDTLAPLAPLFEYLDWFSAGHSFFKTFWIESDFLDQEFPQRAIQHSCDLIFMDGTKEDGFHFIPLSHHLRLLVHIERGRQLPLNYLEPHHSGLKLVPELFFQQWKDFPIEPVTMRAVE